MVTKEIWRTYSQDKKIDVVRGALEELYAIDNKKHKLSGTREQGKLASIKKNLETFIISTQVWEEGN